MTIALLNTVDIRHKKCAKKIPKAGNSHYNEIHKQVFVAEDALMFGVNVVQNAPSPIRAL